MTKASSSMHFSKLTLFFNQSTVYKRLFVNKQCYGAASLGAAVHWTSLQSISIWLYCMKFMVIEERCSYRSPNAFQLPAQTTRCVDSIKEPSADRRPNPFRLILWPPFVKTLFEFPFYHSDCWYKRRTVWVVFVPICNINSIQLLKWLITFHLMGQTASDTT